jgi:hypothetical protein
LKLAEIKRNCYQNACAFIHTYWYPFLALKLEEILIALIASKNTWGGRGMYKNYGP